MNRQRISNILVAATIALLVAVWTPTAVVGSAGVHELNWWTDDALHTAYGVMACPEGGKRIPFQWGCGVKNVRSGHFQGLGIGIWALITGVVLGGLYFVNGSLALRFSKETEQ